MKHNICKF